jgi:hypothetical protein
MWCLQGHLKGRRYNRRVGKLPGDSGFGKGLIELLENYNSLVTCPQQVWNLLFGLCFSGIEAEERTPARPRLPSK